MKSLISAISICFFSLISFAQNASKEEFKVLSQKGKNTANAKALSSNLKLLPTDKIIIAQGGYVGLLHKSGKTLELKTPGVYLVADLSKKLQESKVSLSKKYSEFIFGELAKTEEDINANYKKHSSTTGSVERGERLDLQLLLPVYSPKQPEVKLLKENFTLQWNKPKDGNAYVIQAFVNDEEDLILNQETKDTNFYVDINKLGLANVQSFYVIVKKKNETNAAKFEKRKIVFLNDVQLTEQISEINNTLIENNSLNNYIKAKFYQENNLFLNAFESYKSALRLDPEVIDYKDAYNNLLFNYGLNSFILK